MNGSIATVIARYRSHSGSQTTRRWMAIAINKTSTQQISNQLQVDHVSKVEDLIAKVAISIGQVQEQIVNVGPKIEEVQRKLDQKNVTNEKREVLMLILKSLMDEKKALMDEKKALMEKKKALMEKEKALMEKETALLQEKRMISLMGNIDIDKLQSSSIGQAKKEILSKGVAVIALPFKQLSALLNVDRIFVRDFYDKFIEHKLKNFELSMNTNRGAVIMGTPGIGKSTFGWYMVWKALQMGKTVIYNQYFYPQAFVIFHGNERVQVCHYIPSEYDNPNTVLVVDSLVPRSSRCFTVLVTSPDRGVVKEFLKVPGVKRHFFPLYTADELKLLRDSCYDGKSIEGNVLSDDELQRRFSIVFGGVPRFVLSDAAASNSEMILREFVAKATSQLRFGQVQPSHFYDLSHNIFHLIVSRERFDIETIAFASPDAARILDEQDAEQKYEAMNNFLGFASRNPVYGSLYGAVFETMVRRELPLLEFLETMTMCGSDGIRVPLRGSNDVATAKEFKSVSEICVTDPAHVTVWKPVDRNFPAVDFIVTSGSRVYFLQVTVASTHDIVARTDNKTGLLDTIEVMRSNGFAVVGNDDINFIWVLPSHVKSGFQKKGFPKSMPILDAQYLRQHLKEFKAELNPPKALKV